MVPRGFLQPKVLGKDSLFVDHSELFGTEVLKPVADQRSGPKLT